MFTGIITSTGRVESVAPMPRGRRLAVEAGWEAPDYTLGESIAIDGACMTVVGFEGSVFSVEISSESLERTTLGGLEPGDRVNLERALRLGDRLGGHFVTGHVDGLGTLAAISPSGECTQLSFELPASMLSSVVDKGSLCIDGVSLTVNTVDDASCRVEVMIVPHTLQETTLSDRAIGDRVNIELDMLGKYVERILAGRS